MTEEQERAALVAETRRWLATPYHHHAHVLGAGVDCAYLLVEAHVGAGLADRFEVEEYTHDWHLHRNEERYLSKVEAYLKRVDDCELPLEKRPALQCLPGDVLVWRHGRTYSHGAIVSEWPKVIHASHPDGAVVEVDIRGTIMAEKPMRVYSFWGNTSEPDIRGQGEQG